jgi:type IV pilus assembly protein PilM
MRSLPSLRRVRRLTGSVVGLDIGSVSIRAVEATKGKDRPVIHNYGQEMLPDGAVVGGVVTDARAVSAALRELWASQNFHTKSVVLGVSHQQVVVREVQVTNLPERELKQALPFQIRDVLPIPVDQAMIDFYPLENPGKNEHVRGLLIAAPKEAVIDMVLAVEHAGLFVVDVDLSCFAALRAGAHLVGDTEAVVDIGANGTNIIIHTDGVPQIVRSVPRGGLEITKQMAARLDMSMAAAETMKCRVGLLRGPGMDSSAVVSEAIRPLVNEIRSSFNYFSATNPTKQVSRLSLVGGSATLPGLVEQLSEALNVSVVLADPLQRVNDSRSGGRHDSLRRFRSSAAVSVGLTMGAA